MEEIHIMSPRDGNQHSNQYQQDDEQVEKKEDEQQFHADDAIFAGTGAAVLLPQPMQQQTQQHQKEIGVDIDRKQATMKQQCHGSPSTACGSSDQALHVPRGDEEANDLLIYGTSGAAHFDMLEGEDDPTPTKQGEWSSSSKKKGAAGGAAGLGGVPEVDTARCMPSSASSFVDWAACTLLGYDVEEYRSSGFYFGVFKSWSSSSNASQKQKNKKARVTPSFNFIFPADGGSANPTHENTAGADDTAADMHGMGVRLP
jgi:hypothetical protein